MNGSEAGFYYNVTDRSVSEALTQFGLHIVLEKESWPQNPNVLVSGLGSHERLERYLLGNVPGIKMTGIDASLGLDNKYNVFLDDNGVFHLHPTPPIKEIPNSRAMTYEEYKKMRLQGVPEINLITNRVPPINLPDSSIDIIIDINGPAAYAHQAPGDTLSELLSEYERISNSGIVYVATSMPLYPEAFFTGVMGSHRSVRYFSGSQGNVAKIFTE